MQVLAEDIALAVLRHRRHGRLESLLLSKAGRPTSGPELLHPDIYREARLRQDIETLRHFMAWLTDSTSEVPASAVDTLCGWLRPSGNDESLHSLLARGARDESAPAAEPTTAADRLTRLTAGTWLGDREAGTAWACERRRYSLARRCRYSPPGSWDECLLDRCSVLVGGRVEEGVELSGEGVGCGPAEVVGDDDDVVAAAEPDGPDPCDGAAVGAELGVVDLDDDLVLAASGPAVG